MIRRWTGIAALALLLFSSLALATTPLNGEPDGQLLRGYDPVSYFEQGEPLRGDEGIQLEHNGVTVLFSSTENRDLFVADPERYLPAYGGFCSYGIRLGKKLDADPIAWKIVDDVLYVQLNLGTRVIWLEEMERNIEIADRLWPTVSELPMAGD